MMMMALIDNPADVHWKCTVNVTGQCPNDATEVMVVHHSGPPEKRTEVFLRCAEHPAVRWATLIARADPHAEMVVLPLVQKAATAGGGLDKVLASLRQHMLVWEKAEGQSQAEWFAAEQFTADFALLDAELKLGAAPPADWARADWIRKQNRLIDDQHAEIARLKAELDERSGRHVEHCLERDAQRVMDTLLKEHVVVPGTIVRATDTGREWVWMGVHGWAEGNRQGTGYPARQPADFTQAIHQPIPYGQQLARQRMLDWTYVGPTDDGGVILSGPHMDATDAAPVVAPDDDEIRPDGFTQAEVDGQRRNPS